MINGSHVLLYSSDPDADRAFFQETLALHFVDAGHGWLIFALPPAELAVHPLGEGDRTPAHALGAELYLMCDDLASTLSDLTAKGVKHTEVFAERWGRRTSLILPSGAKLGLYQPMHPTAH